MIIERPAGARGMANHGWLNSAHTFSFANYYDPQWMGFGPLRVINEDRVAAGGGFAPHGHANMEIISVVIDGQLAHKDSEGNHGIITAGDVQWMSAGSGVQHSEMNGSSTEPVHFLQIWIQPDETNAKPKYAQTNFPFEGRLNDWTVLASKDGANDAMPIRQDAQLLGRGLRKGDATTRTLDPLRKYWLQVISGSLTVSIDDRAHELAAGDALGFAEETGELSLRQTAEDDVQLLWFDLPR